MGPSWANAVQRLLLVLIALEVEVKPGLVLGHELEQEVEVEHGVEMAARARSFESSWGTSPLPAPAAWGRGPAGRPVLVLVVLKIAPEPWLVVVHNL